MGDDVGGARCPAEAPLALLGIAGELLSPARGVDCCDVRFVRLFVGDDIVSLW